MPILRIVFVFSVSSRGRGQSGLGGLGPQFARLPVIFPKGDLEGHGH